MVSKNFLAIITVFTMCAAALGEWHQSSLYLSGGDYWRSRITIQIFNGFDAAAAGEPVPIPVGDGPGQVAIAGARAESVRLCDANGAEMLFRIASTGDNAAVERGPVPAGSELVIPVEVEANGSVTYYLYFDNPAAWAVPDTFDAVTGVRNGGVEQGSGDTPEGWKHDTPDAHHRALWVEENPHSGQKCLKTVVDDGAEPTWISTRQYDIHVTGGCRYRMTAWVKAENVDGYAGWYIHVGNENDSMLLNRGLSGGGGTYGWKQVTTEFTAPAAATGARLGTVLRGTGVAWFDDATLERLDPPQFSITTTQPERRELAEAGADAPWFDDDPADDTTWDCRIPLRVINVSDAPLKNLAATVRLSEITRCGFNPQSLRITFDGETVPAAMLDDMAVFECEVPPQTASTYYAYLSFDTAIGPNPAGGYEALLHSTANLVTNPSFELGDARPENWDCGDDRWWPSDVVLDRTASSLYGEYCTRTLVPQNKEQWWYGWRQNVPVSPGHSYLYAGWIKTENLRDEITLHAHYRKADGGLCDTLKYTAVPQRLSGTNDWSLLWGSYTMPPDAAFFQLHLTMLATGTAWHDGIILAETISAHSGKIEDNRPADHPLEVWAVNPVVKVFRNDVPPAADQPITLSAARNEKEPLQLAVRSRSDKAAVTIEVEPPNGQTETVLGEFSIGVVGYVPVDIPSNYYRWEGKPWYRKIPTQQPGCDGWAGLWPDPVVPGNSLDLAADTTQPIWITFTIPTNAPAGDYDGAVVFRQDGAVLRRVPFTLHVWDFALPDETHLKAVYDIRLNDYWRETRGNDQQIRRELWSFMAERRLSPDTIMREIAFEYENGVATADFSEFDAAAEYYFDELGIRHAYTPWTFYCFGWGYPPRQFLGEDPYPGEYPYAGANRSVLRPEYKQVYQACLKLFWDHITEKGWADRFTMYISDEPHFDQDQIRIQMKALCDMIHEVSADIPIYSSTWRDCPDWHGYLDVWGVGHYGCYPVSEMQQVLADGDRLWFTTDSQMCLDTPYSAIERLLPHYCFEYGADAYEFWGLTWATYPPEKFGWHSFISQSSTPGESYYVRYPNGDGYLAYPGGAFGVDGPVSSVRLEQAREGLEDYEYLFLLRKMTARAESAGHDTTAARSALDAASNMVPVPSGIGRYSTKILPNPDTVFEVRAQLAQAIEQLSPVATWPIPGDANGDCKVNIVDLIYVRNRTGKSPTVGANWRADVNEDGTINILDLIYIRNRLNTTCGKQP